MKQAVYCISYSCIKLSSYSCRVKKKQFPVFFTTDTMGDSSDEEVFSTEATSPQTSFHAATNSVLSTLRGIRTTPQLRQNFVAGCQDNAMREVQRSFRSKRKGQSKKKEAKRKKKYFKHTIACFSGPDAKFNPTRQEWDALYSMGLGKAWKGHVEACIPGNLLAKDFHGLLLSMFPALLSSPYELCRLGGAYNNEVQEIGDSQDKPSFFPHWSPESLKPHLGKAQLLIRPQLDITAKAMELQSTGVM